MKVVIFVSRAEELTLELSFDRLEGECMFYLELSVDEDKKLSKLINYFEEKTGFGIDKHDAILRILDMAYSSLAEQGDIRAIKVKEVQDV